MTKINNKLLFLILAILIFAVLLVSSKFTTFAAAEPTITVGSAKGNAGDTVDVTITMSNNPGLVSMNLYVNYDTDVLKLIEVKDGGLLSGVTHSDNYTSPYSLCWVNDLSKENFKVNGVLAKLTFEINKNTKLKQTKVSLEQDILDCNVENVVFNLKSGSVNVGNTINESKVNSSETNLNKKQTATESRSDDFYKNASDKNNSTDGTFGSTGQMAENEVAPGENLNAGRSDTSENSNESVSEFIRVTSDSANNELNNNGTVVTVVVITIVFALILGGLFIYLKQRRKKME